MTERNSQTDQSIEVPPASGEDEISLLDLAIVLAKHKLLIIGLPVLVALITLAGTYLMTDTYTSTTKIMPPRQGQSASSALLAQLGGLAGLVGGAAGGGGGNDLYIAMLDSRTIADNMAKRFGPTKVSETAFPASKVRNEWKARFKTEKGGLIAIEVDDKDPKRAAEVANAYVDELYKLTSGLALTDVSQRRLFFERQLAMAKDNLDKAEISARDALERRGVASVNSQGLTLLQNAAQLRAQITVKEVQIGAMRSFATDRNSEMQRAEQEIATIKRELAKLEGAGNVKAAPNATNSSTNALDSNHLLRDLKYSETLYELIARQYELAKVDEAKEASVIQVVESAIEQEQPSWPNRKLLLPLSALAALFVGILWAFVREAVEKVNGDPRQAERLRAIRRYLAWR